MGPTTDLYCLPIGAAPPSRLNAVIEIPRGGQSKYEYDRKTGLFRLDRVLYSSVHYPGHYGFVPGTRADDGDPVDVLVHGLFDSMTGVLMEVRPVGMLRMRDEHGADEKILAIPAADPRYTEVEELHQLAPHFLREVEHFFRVYKELEGVEVETMGWQPREAAEAYVTASVFQWRDTDGE